MFFTKKEKLNVAELKTLFETQKDNLLKREYFKVLGMSLEEFNDRLDSLWKSVLNATANLEIVTRGNIPLLLVVGQGDLQQKITTIQGHTELDLAKIKKEPTEPALLYVLLDVEDGENMVASSPKDALKKLGKQQRFALTINESIALLTHYPKLLKNHYVISAGSFYTKEQETLPLLWLLDEHGNPELHYAWFHIAHGSYGVASYGAKL